MVGESWIGLRLGFGSGCFEGLAILFDYSYYDTSGFYTRKFGCLTITTLSVF